MGDAATPICSRGACSSPTPFSLCTQPWRAYYEVRCRVRPWRTLQFASRKWRIRADCGPLASNSRCHSIEIGRLQQASLLSRFRLRARANDFNEDVGKNVDTASASPKNIIQYPLNEAPSSREKYVAAHTNNDVMPLSEKGAQQSASGFRYTEVTNEVATNGKQARDMETNKQEAEMGNDAPQRSLEEDYGFLKEQVEADRRIQLASQQGSDIQSITDTAKPLKRSKVVAKQVISQSSARLIGFASQLWVSVRLFRVVALEVRPSLLSGEIDRVFLADVCQIGDVVLVSDESALENEMTALDCETLVGYDVVTEDGNFLGKIRDYSFDLHDGKLTSLEFDSVGFSLVPSSLISTYRLDVEEVIEVLSDSILVKVGAESRIKRLSKGLWQLPNAGERRRSQKLARSRMQKRSFSERTDIAGRGRLLPSSMRPRYSEGPDFEGVDAREGLADRGSFPKDYDGPRRYRGR